MRIIRLLSGVIALLGVVAIMSGCAPPAVTGLDLTPNETIAAFGGASVQVTITFRNNTGAPVTINMAHTIGPGRLNYQVDMTDCFTRSPIPAGGTCSLRLRLIRTGNVGATYYVSLSGRYRGGVHLRP